ncbi:Hypothetical_protein [Hexamita inflata]|uniref:Hypothetical_protein n=1 Tax=Hexamita inflata TaxID=28002 RepID=A0AA86UGK6_9EUKA|nr:Hypothetical protein HINF_LOCUS27288 [Hexamita inflata]
MQIPAALLEFLQDMRETIEAQGQKIHELENRIKVLEKDKPKNNKIKNPFLLHESLELVDVDNVQKLVRTEAGMTAFAVSTFKMKKVSLKFSENKPQFVYVGIVDQKYVPENGQVESKDCYLINTSGKGKIPHAEWQDYDEPMFSVINEATRFDIEVKSGGMDLMVDFGRNCCMFPKIPEEYRIVIGLFGQGEIQIDNIE